MALMIVGCYRDREPPRRFVPGDALYEQFTTRGSRVVLRDADGQPTMKVRLRTNHARIYDHQLLSAGQVRLDDDHIEQRSRDGQTRISPTWVDDDTAILDDGWRLERSGDNGWDVFSAETGLVALWRVDDDGDWTMRLTGAQTPTLSVDVDQRATRIIAPDGTTHLEIPVTDWSPLRALALGIDDLNPLPRYTLAVWADEHL